MAAGGDTIDMFMDPSTSLSTDDRFLCSPFGLAYRPVIHVAHSGPSIFSTFFHFWPSTKRQQRRQCASPSISMARSILAGHSLQIVTLPARRRIRNKKENADAWRISTVIRGCHSLRTAADRQQIKSVPTFDWTLPRRMRQNVLRIRPAAPSLSGKKGGKI